MGISRVLAVALIVHVNVCAMSMEVYKKEHPAIKRGAPLEKKSQKIKVRFVEINSFDFAAFEQKFGLKLEQCILDGVCIFSLKGSLPQTIDAIQKEEKSVAEVAIYQNYNMKPY